jgi:hypothetical protein
VNRLASSNDATRIAATDAIEALGLEAIPALREAMTGQEGIGRQRAQQLLMRIGSRRLLRPTLVTVHARDRPIADVLSELSASAGVEIDIESPDDPRWSSRRISVDLGPISLFEALDRTGNSAGFRTHLSHAWGSASKSRARVRVGPYDGGTPPTSYAGPYRIVLESLHRHRESRQATTPAESAIREEFFGVLELAGEPGLVLERNGPVRLIEALDDQGRDLTLSTAEDSPSSGYSVRLWDSTDPPTLPIRLRMNLPSIRGRSIARLRGYIPIISLTRSDEVAAWPMAEAEGKTIAMGQTTIKIVKISHQGGIDSLELMVRDVPFPDSLSFPAGPRQVTLATLTRGITLDDMVRVEDVDGISYRSQTIATSPQKPDGFANYRMNLFPARPVKGPARTRIFGVTAVATEVPFDFKDLPIP